MTRDELNFEMTSDKGIPGHKKAAILFGELGSAAAGVQDYLTPQEIKKLNKAMRKLGKKYNPYNSIEVNNEVQVLETLERFGKVRNIYRDVAGERKAFQKKMATPAAKIRNAINDYPEQVASVLSAWLSKDSAK